MYSMDNFDDELKINQVWNKDILDFKNLTFLPLCLVFELFFISCRTTLNFPLGILAFSQGYFHLLFVVSLLKSY